jgi:hypothetical protein
VSFGTPKNPRTEYITFDVVDMLYPYNAIFGKGLLNTCEAALPLGYLYLKIPATFNIIIVFGSQQEARNIEKGFAPGHKNVHFLREESKRRSTSIGNYEEEALAKYKKSIEVEGEFKKVHLDSRVPDRTVCIDTEVNLQEQADLLAFLDKNNVFAWSTSDLVGVSRDVIEHQLQVNTSVKTKK